MKNFLKFFRLSNLKRQVEELGGSLTTKNIVTLLFSIALGAFITGYLLKLQLAYCLIIILFFIACIPSLIIAKFRSDYQKIRFDDLVSYLEHLIYAFHKSGKIRDSLLDAQEVTSKTVSNVIKKMLKIIDYDNTSTVYEKAFSIMQSEYNCSRVQILHSYLLRCENNGGNNTTSLNMLLADTRSWADRTLNYQFDRQKIKRNVLVSIGLAMLTCGLMINLIPEEYTSQIVSYPAYQIATTIILCLCILTYVIVSNLVAKSYLDYEVENGNEAEAIKKMRYLRHKSRRKLKPLVIKLVMLITVMGVCMYLGYKLAVVPLALLALFVSSQDIIKHNSAVRSVTKELNKAFPVWMRTLILYLQTDNVHVAISKSRDTCPKIMKEDLDAFCNDLANDPVSIKPYSKFLDSFNIPTLKMSINYLYSVACFGSEDMLTQLDYLVEQNNQATINEEKLRNEDALAGINVFIFAPMLFACAKFIVDLLLFMSIFMDMMSAYV